MDQKPSLIDYIPKYWPLVLTFASVFVFGVRADAQITQLQDKTVVYDKMMNDRTDRMARVEERLNAQEHQLEKMDGKLDDLLERK